MLRIATYAVTLFLLVVMGSGSAFAADKIKKQDRKKDGSCQSYLIKDDAGVLLAGNGQGKGAGDRDRKKDGSCQSYTTQQDPGYILAGKGKGKGSGDRDRRKDGSCQG